jgi:hypothetical protein
MQPNTSPTRPSAHRPARPNRRRRLAIGALALTLTAVVTACGGSSDAGGSDGAAPAASETTAASSSGSGTDEATTTAIGGAPAIDVCEEVSQEDVAAILTEADLVSAEANSAIPAPNCGYAIEIGGAGSGATADVVTITWNDPSFFDGQKELQTDETELTGFDTDAFAFGDGGDILVRGETGTWAVTQGVELSDGGQPASAEQLAAIAKLVQGL